MSSFFAGTNPIEFQAELRRAKKLKCSLIKFLTFVKAFADVAAVVVVSVQTLGSSDCGIVFNTMACKWVSGCLKITK